MDNGDVPNFETKALLLTAVVIAAIFGLGILAMKMAWG